MKVNVISTLSIVLGIVATIIALCLLFPDKKRPTLRGFGKIFNDVLNFKTLLFEVLMKALYVYTTTYVFFTGFFTIFRETSFGMDFSDNLLAGLKTMFLGVIIVRVVYELFIMLVVLIKNVAGINKKLGGEEHAQYHFAVVPKLQMQQQYPPQQYPPQQYPPQQAPQQGAVPCPRCGNVVAPHESFCNTCGTKVK